ncbi:hypothetical protein F5Y15DRAFT_404200 [Xylariaceae sp. FL0016]|nr:hypothetical protein F5Y15DRAFT_404200 [Xylariaceae sp. FL0016]
MFYIRRLLITLLVFVLIVFTLTFLPRALVPVPPSREKQEADAAWINSSPHWLDRQACRWLGLCGLLHLKPDPPGKPKNTYHGYNGQELRRRLSNEAHTAEWELRGASNLQRPKSIPGFVLENAPLVHLYSKEYFWPTDIADHLEHVIPYSDDNQLITINGLTLANMGELNSNPGFLYLRSKDDVESRPKWLHSTSNIPVAFEKELDYRDGASDAPHERNHMSEGTTWFDVDPEHPLRRVADPRKVPVGRPLPRRSRISNPRDEFRVTSQSKQNEPDASGYSHAPVTLILVDKGSGVIDAFWFFFYAYNLGQTVLRTRYGNHVGDWEHAMIRFESGLPRAVFFSEHEGGQAYAWQALEKHGNATDAQRPIIYSAVGSHAMFAMPGNHPYVLPFQMLKDVTDRGPLWDPAKNFRGYWYDGTTGDDSGSLEPAAENPDAPTSWFHYEGAWGDRVYDLGDQRQWRLFGQYHYQTGPQGPKFKNLGRRKMCQISRCKILYSIAEGRRRSWHS